MKSRKSSMIALLLMVATQGAVAQSGNSVTVKQGVEEADKWTATPNPAESGQTVTVTYDGTLKVKSLEANEVTPTDLSMVDCAGYANANGQTTANCYMVHTKGDYRLPLVYGNAIKNGEVNSAAYTGPSSGTNITATFPNHAGDPINAPWITKSTDGEGVDKGMGISVESAELLWQDAKGLVTKVGISGDYLTLTVGKDATEQEGNAVVAAKTADGTIVWSWHIWVTRQTFAAADLTTVATGSHDYQLTPVNVGWVGTSFGKGYSPYYQWGRKDAFIPADITVVDMEQPEETPTNTGSDSGSSSGQQYVSVVVTVEPIGTIHYTNNHSVYDIDGTAVTGFTLDNSTSTTIAANIKDPTRFWYKANNTYSNMWNAQTGSSQNVSSATVKTVYDPCPPGFCVPTDNLYKYVVSVGTSNFGWNDDRKGFILKTSTAKVLFPFLGKREDTEKAEEVDIDGYYWSATGDSSGKAKALYIHRNDERRYDSLTRVNGHSVRAVAEE